MPDVPSSEAGGVHQLGAHGAPKHTSAPLLARIAHAWRAYMESAVAVPDVPLMDAGTAIVVAGLPSNVPQQTTAPVERIAHAWRKPTAIASAPELTVPGGVRSASAGLLAPQQMTAPVVAWIAQLVTWPVAIAVAVPLVPFTEAGGVACPCVLSPQHTTAPVLRIAQEC